MNAPDDPAADALPSAIAPHLRRPRTRPAALPADFVPARNAWAARFQPARLQIGMACFGLQGAARDAGALRALLGQLRSSWAAGGPDRHELARSFAHPEGAAPGLEETVCMTYWRDAARLREWMASPAFAGWRHAVLSHGARPGLFVELHCAKASDFETLFSTDRFEGLAAMADAPPVRGIREHGYWGGMRDRLPAAQTSDLEPHAALAVARSDAIDLGPAGLRPRVVLAPHDHLAVIRSGQDWTDTAAEERDHYLQHIEPALREAMDTLSRNGEPHGCYANRYLQHVEEAGEPLEKSFGLSHWRSLAHLERWAWTDPEHLRIFQRFLGMARKLGQTRLRLYHEVMVLAAQDQYYEYVGCAPRCGVLGGLRA